MLTVEVISFSYKKGYPENHDGNGGGFVFDCRFLNNPGRYEPYKEKTGKDQEVKKFLKENSDADEFLRKVWKITDEATLAYRDRGFTSLQICFGCTGGRHRSVYCAESTARHILESFDDVGVNLIHENL